ncbi:MAG TPA: hypothetical protein VGY56_04305 [Verrucomicrobiae bacterium]|nr:hypothetical protein [Verrucomicrobiae bacterium]
MGILFAWKILMPEFQQHPTTPWIITGKTTGPSGEANYLEFHAPEYPGPDGRQTRPFPGWFCNRARPGDVMLMDIGGGQTKCIFLTRNGQIIGRLFDATQKQGLWFTAISIMPILSLPPCKNQRVRLTILSLAGTVEIIAIGAALVTGLFILALEFGGAD